MKDHFWNQVIGQERVRKELSYYLEVYYKTNVFKNLLFLAEKGAGKTLLCRKVGEKLGKRYVEINAATIKNVNDFFDGVFVTHILGRPACLVIDEIHALDKKTGDFLLSVLAPNKDDRNIVNFQGGQFTVDFRQFTFMGATTEGNKVFPALKNRLKQITLGKYTQEDIKEILILYANFIDIDSVALEYLVQHCKVNARSAAELGKEILNFCLVKGVKELTLDLAIELIDLLNLYELGLTRLEVEILASIADHNGVSLTRLAAKSGLTAQAQRGIELELLANDLIEIQNGRRITMKGREYLKRNGF